MPGRCAIIVKKVGVKTPLALGDLGPELGARLREPADDPFRVVAFCQSGVAEVELERDGFERARSLRVQLDEEQQAEIVAQPLVHRVVVDEVAEVVEDATGGAVEDVGGVAGDERRARVGERRGRGLDVARRADRHVGTPVAGDQHGVVARFCDGVRQPAARVVLEVGERDAGPVGRRREVARVVGGGDDREAMLARRDGARRSRAGLVRAGSDAGDAGRLEVVERVQQRLRAVVERVVVGERHAVDADARRAARPRAGARGRRTASRPPATARHAPRCSTRG